MFYNFGTCSCISPLLENKGFSFSISSAAAIHHTKVILNTFAFCQNKIKSLKLGGGREKCL